METSQNLICGTITKSKSQYDMLMKCTLQNKLHLLQDRGFLCQYNCSKIIRSKITNLEQQEEKAWGSVTVSLSDGVILECCEPMG